MEGLAQFLHVLVAANQLSSSFVNSSGVILGTMKASNLSTEKAVFPQSLMLSRVALFHSALILRSPKLSPMKQLPVERVLSMLKSGKVLDESPYAMWWLLPLAGAPYTPAVKTLGRYGPSCCVTS